jgi:hypothetical protein
MRPAVLQLAPVCSRVLGLTLKFGIESLFALGVSLRPNARTLFDLLLYHLVEGDRDLMGGVRRQLELPKK